MACCQLHERWKNKLKYYNNNMICRMGEYLGVLKSALADPALEGVECICPSNYSKLRTVISDLPPDAHISEWRYGDGQIRYRYHTHVDGAGARLREAFENGARGGNPTLTAVYLKKDLDAIIQEHLAHSVC
jgi:hypothetical protein